ncbi:caspase family protein [Marinicella sp. W31]|uniref:caspase family protein n=1 Tax=Marinicella sp. W31 TaxID=3023713 RepID=UPI00375654AC
MKAFDLKIFFLVLVVTGLSACGSNPTRVTEVKDGQVTPDQLYIVDCLLPPQIRQLGQNYTYASPRQPIKLPARECALRGGEYVAYDEANFASVAKVWQTQAQAGDAQAQTYMGELFEKGINGTPDYASAARWYQKAADQGHSVALLNLGNLYEKGLGVQQDSVKAIELYRKASGITDGNLELVTEEQMRKRRDQEYERIRLQQEVGRLKNQLTDVNKNYQSSLDYMNQANLEIKRLQGQLKVNQDDPTVKRRIAELQNQVKDLENKNLKSKELANALMNQISDSSEGSLALNTDELAINVISPDVVVTRGIRSVPVLDQSAERISLMGRVNPPAEIKALQLNNQNIIDRMNDTGLFSAELQLSPDDTPVSIEAIKSDGTKTIERFVVVRQPLPEIKPRYLSDLFTNRFRDDLGDFHALVIGNNQYSDFENLSTAVNDAEEIARVFRERYGYKTQLLTNASQMEILQAFAEYQKTMGKLDNLIVYYAGHGLLDGGKRGYWIPVDADETDTSTWISNEDITQFMSAMQAKHVMVMADSCYSGTMSGSTIRPLPEDAAENDILFTSRVKARTVLTSGGLQPVLDSGGQGHSVFASALLDVLNENDGVMEGYRLFEAIQQQVKLRSRLAGLQQVPEYSAIKHAGHEGSEYYFLPVKT